MYIDVPRSFVANADVSIGSVIANIHVPWGVVANVDVPWGIEANVHRCSSKFCS